ncbi:MAG: 23S rRNA (pseudouridine(1915)-N(3))-methyltransferase RlmH [Bacteroidia bacterium]|nr:23S rRNA (pseudouridine(1915)-N(3))-methyltransferase RlmH [Bacteroidia bacterium]
MKISILQTGKTTEKHISEGVEIYSARLKKYCGFGIITIPDIKDTRNMPVKEQKSREGKKILQALGKDDFVILLDERGKEISTVNFASWLEGKSQMQGKRLVFVIGGPWGFSEEVNEIADFRLSLSKMTFPHQLVRLLFIEQLYRAFTIIKGEPYHHE